MSRVVTRSLFGFGFGGAAIASTISSAVDSPAAREATVAALAKFLPPHVGDAVTELTKIVHREFPGDLSITDIGTALSVMAIMQGLSKKPAYEVRKFEAAEDSPIARRFSHYMKYATAAYGKPEETPLAKTEEQWIAVVTGIPLRKVGRYVGGKEVQGKAMLEHFVAVDDGERAVVLALKGTATLEGALKDLRLVYKDVDFWGQNYQVHGGMLDSALGLVEFPALVEQVKKELKANPGYKLVVLGHSLGGGVAGLVAPLLAAGPTREGRFLTNGRTIPGRQIECYGFEPAASVDEELRQKTKSMIYSLVNKNDIVPALSHGAISDFKALASYLKQNTPYLAGIVDGLSKNSLNADEHIAKFRSLATNKKLVPPGRVWAIDMNAKGKLEIGEVLNVNQRFGEARFIFGMLTNHKLGDCVDSMAALEGLE